MYRNEADTLYIHLWRLYDYVDKFIIVFSNATYTGIPQNLTFEPFEKEIKQYMDKVDIAYFDHTCNRVLYPESPQLRCIDIFFCWIIIFLYISFCIISLAHFNTS